MTVQKQHFMENSMTINSSWVSFTHVRRAFNGAGIYGE
jgi:hypothetical protein